MIYGATGKSLERLLPIIVPPLLPLLPQLYIHVTAIAHLIRSTSPPPPGPFPSLPCCHSYLSSLVCTLPGGTGVARSACFALGLWEGKVYLRIAYRSYLGAREIGAAAAASLALEPGLGPGPGRGGGRGGWFWSRCAFTTPGGREAKRRSTVE